MDTEMMTALERAFSALSREERETIIRHGVALRVADLKKRLFLAESKVRSFAVRYQTTLGSSMRAGSPTMQAMRCMKITSCGIIGPW